MTKRNWFVVEQVLSDGSKVYDVNCAYDKDFVILAVTYNAAVEIVEVLERCAS